MKKVKGEIYLPGDKSLSHRAALFSSFGKNKADFQNFNFNEDCSATLKCLKSLGIQWRIKQSVLQIAGKHISEWKPSNNPLDAKNSGTTTRLLSGILANLSFKSALTGDSSLRLRPMKRILDPLKQMGAMIESNNNLLPLQFYPVEKLKSIRYKLPVASAQVKSAVLLAGLFADGQTEVIEPVQTRDHTERLLGLKIVQNADGSKSIFSSGDVEIPDLSMEIPGDFSSAVFFITAALLLPGSELLIKNVSLNPTRIGFLDILKKMGAKIEQNIYVDKPEPCGELFIKHSFLKNIEIPASSIPNVIDEIPALAILASQSEGKFILRGAEELRYKESDRLKALAENLKAIGVNVTEYQDGLEITGPQSLKGGNIKSYNDHRIVMAFAIANLISGNQIKIDNPDCVNVSFPAFWDILNNIIEK
jgi:3-phosphoshikimate 1-carboxyvinyltransferase